MELLKTLLAIWGAVLSTILAFDQLRQRRRGRVFLEAEWIVSSDEVHVEAVNIGMRPITFGPIDIAYGESPKTAIRLLTISKERFQLQDGEAKEWVVIRQDILDSRERSRAQIGERNFVWVRAHLFAAGEKATTVTINAEAVKATSLYKPAESSIAADLFVGFPREEVLKQRRRPPYTTRNR
jgi:hypothetical protein